MQALPSSDHHRKSSSTARLTPQLFVAAYRYPGHGALSRNGSYGYWPTQDQNQREFPESAGILLPCIWLP